MAIAASSVFPFCVNRFTAFCAFLSTHNYHNLINSNLGRTQRKRISASGCPARAFAAGRFHPEHPLLVPIAKNRDVSPQGNAPVSTTRG